MSFEWYLRRFSPPLSEEQVKQIVAEHERVLKEEVAKTTAPKPKPSK